MGNLNKLLFFFFLLVNFQCRSRLQEADGEKKSESLSEKITYFYNSVLNNDILTSIGEGRTNYQMKYLLDTIIKKNYNKNDTDIKCCIFEFADLSLSGNAFFIDNDDTIWYRLNEIHKADKRKHSDSIHGMYRIGTDLNHIFYTIVEKKLKTEDIDDRCLYLTFFKNTMCNGEDFIAKDGGPTNEIILKFWNKEKGSVGIEFYNPYYDDPQVIMKLNQVKSKESLLKAGYDSTSIIQKKIIFVN